MTRDLDAIRRIQDPCGESTIVFLVDSGVDTDHLPGATIYGDTVHENPPGRGTLMARIVHQSCPDCAIYSIQSLDPRGDRTTSGAFAEVLARIDLLIADCASPRAIISLGTGHFGTDGFERRAVEDFVAAGHVIVAAAGDDGSSRPMYPAAYDGVVAVGAVIPDARRPLTWNRADYSNYGDWVTISVTDSTTQLRDEARAGIETLAASMQRLTRDKTARFVKTIRQEVVELERSRAERIREILEEFMENVELRIATGSVSDRQTMELLRLVARQEEEGRKRGRDFATSQFTTECMMHSCENIQSHFGYERNARELACLICEHYLPKPSIERLWTLQPEDDVVDVISDVYELEGRLAEWNSALSIALDEWLEWDREKTRIATAAEIVEKALHHQSVGDGLRDAVSELANASDQLVFGTFYDPSSGPRVSTAVDRLLFTLRQLAGQTVTSSGTSFMAAEISGLAGHLLTLHPNLSASDVVAIIKETAHKKVVDEDRAKSRARLLFDQRLDSLVDGLKSSNADTRNHSANELVHMASVAVDATADTILNRLRPALESANPWQRINAAAALVAFGEASAIEALYALLTDGMPDIRLCAVRLVGRLGEDAREGLFRALKSEDPKVRNEATRQLWKAKWRGESGKSVTSIMVDHLQEESSPDAVLYGLKLLRDISGTNAVAEVAGHNILRGLADFISVNRRTTLAREAEGLLVEVFTSREDLELQALNGDSGELRRIAARTWARRTGPTRETLEQLLAHDHADVQLAAVRMLADVGVEGLPDLLVRALRSDSREVVEEAASYVLELGLRNEVLLDPAVELLWSNRATPSLAAQLVRIVEGVGTRDARKELKRLKKGAPSPHVRLAARQVCRFSRSRDR